MKKEEITEGKIYSPAGKFAERAKNAPGGLFGAFLYFAMLLDYIMIQPVTRTVLVNYV